MDFKGEGLAKNKKKTETTHLVVEVGLAILRRAASDSTLLYLLSCVVIIAILLSTVIKSPSPNQISASCYTWSPYTRY